MKLVIKFPTRGRHHKFLRVLNKYIKFLDDKSTKIIVSCDNDDSEMNQDHVKELIGRYDNVKLCFGDNKTKIEAINEAIVEVTI